MVIGDGSDSLLSHQKHTVYLHAKPVPYIYTFVFWLFVHIDFSLGFQCGMCVCGGGGYRNQWAKSKRFVWRVATSRRSQ